MRRQLICAFLVQLCVFQAPQTVRAATLNFIPDARGALTGAIEGAVPADKLGSIPLSRGKVTIAGDAIEVTTVPEWQFDRQLVLRGRVLDSSVAVDNNQVIVRGVALFESGPWINYIDSKEHLEKVFTKTTVHSGRISEVTASELVVQPRGSAAAVRVPMSDIQDISSARAYTFSVPARLLSTDNELMQTDARNLRFRATAGSSRGVSTLKASLAKNSDGDLSTGQLVAIGTALSLVQLGQLVPVLAVPLGTQGLRNSQNLLQIQSILQMEQGIP